MKKNKINILMFIFVIYTIFIILNDYFVYFFPVIGKYSYLISFAITLLSFFFIKKNITIEFKIFDKSDIFFLLLIMFFFIIRVAIPDSSFDVLNYHLINQENPFVNNVSFNFFPGRWINTFSFPLGDRMFYFFRIITNYRLGIIFNYLVLILIYYQFKQLIKCINLTKNEFYISLAAFLSIMTEQILANASTYYTDLISIPLFLELLFIILNEDNNNYYTLFIGGLLISLKLSNAFFVILLAIIYIFKNFKTIKIKHIIIGIFIFSFPFLIYLINNYFQTKNPVFPFYNSIFKSPYLDNINWMETYYGPKNMKELVLWPLYVLTNPRRANDTDIYFGRISYSYISMIILLFIFTYKLIKERKNLKVTYLNNRKEIILVAIYFIYICIWGKFMMGYIRYALILEVYGWLIFLILLKYIFEKHSLILEIIGFSISCLFIYQMSLTVNQILYSCDTLSWRYSALSKNWTEKYNKNKKYIFNSNNVNILNKIDCIGIVDYNPGYAALSSKNIPIISLNEGYANEYGKKEFQNVISKCENIYTITTNYTLERTEKYLDAINYELTDDKIILDVDFLDVENKLYYVKIKEKEIKQ